MTIDFEKLLEIYMRHIVECESVAFMDHDMCHPDVDIGSLEEGYLKGLASRLECEYRERLQLDREELQRAIDETWKELQEEAIQTLKLHQRKFDAK